MMKIAGYTVAAALALASVTTVAGAQGTEPATTTTTTTTTTVGGAAGGLAAGGLIAGGLLGLILIGALLGSGDGSTTTSTSP